MEEPRDPDTSRMPASGRGGYHFRLSAARAAILVHDALLDEPTSATSWCATNEAAAMPRTATPAQPARWAVCLTTSGPGATNLVTGIATAYMDSIPMVALTCQVTTDAIGIDAFQEADMTGITPPHYQTQLPGNGHQGAGPQVAGVVSGGPDPPAGSRAGGPPQRRPWKQVRAVIPEKAARRGYREKVCRQSETTAKKRGYHQQIENAAHLCRGGIVLSEGSANCAPWRRREISGDQHPDGDWRHGPGLSPSPWHAGDDGAWHCNMAAHECDCLIAIGARFDDRGHGKGGRSTPENARIIHIDSDPASNPQGGKRGSCHRGGCEGGRWPFCGSRGTPRPRR